MLTTTALSRLAASLLAALLLTGCLGASTGGGASGTPDAGRVATIEARLLRELTATARAGGTPGSRTATPADTNGGSAVTGTPLPGGAGGNAPPAATATPVPAANNAPAQPTSTPLLAAAATATPVAPTTTPAPGATATPTPAATATSAPPTATPTVFTSLNFVASPETIEKGQCTLLSWLSANMGQLSLSDSRTGSALPVASSGQLEPCPSQDTLYVLSGTGLDGNEYVETVLVTVTQPPLSFGIATVSTANLAVCDGNSVTVDVQVYGDPSTVDVAYGAPDLTWEALADLQFVGGNTWATTLTVPTTLPKLPGPVVFNFGATRTGQIGLIGSGQIVSMTLSPC